MKKIYKYSVGNLIEGIQVPPNGAEFLCLQVQGAPMTWFLVDTNEQESDRAFKVVGTGHEFPENHKYLGSWQDGPFVWHLLEDESKK